MKIVSKFQDYYDSVLALGEYDDNVVYIRNDDTFKSSELIVNPVVEQLMHELQKASIICERGQDLDISLWRHRPSRLCEFRDTQNNTYQLESFCVVFCGKMYPGIQCHITQSGRVTPHSTVYLYTAGDVIAFVHEHGFNPALATRYRGYRKSGRSKSPSVQDYLYRYFEERVINVDWLIEHKITCAVYDTSVSELHINPPLARYQFFKVLDPYTAFQELEMWMAGTLSWPHNMMIEIADKDRIAAHGFDTKYGFRTRPTK